MITNLPPHFECYKYCTSILIVEKVQNIIIAYVYVYWNTEMGPFVGDRSASDEDVEPG